MAFHRRNAQRGRIVLPLLQVSRLCKNKRTAERAYAFGQLSALADKWNAEDRAAGRRPDLVVAAKFRGKWSAADLG